MVNKDREHQPGRPRLPLDEPEQQNDTGERISGNDRDEEIEERFRKEFEDGPGDGREQSQVETRGSGQSLGRPRRPLNGDRSRLDELE